MDKLDFQQLQHDKANELTDRIMAKIGELFLKKEIGTGESNIFVPSLFGPRDDIRQVIHTWLTEEKVDG